MRSGPRICSPVIQTGLRGEAPCPTFPGGLEMEPRGSKEGLPVGKVEEPPANDLSTQPPWSTSPAGLGDPRTRGQSRWEREFL